VRLGNQMVFRVSKFWNSLYVAKRARLKGAFPKATGLRFDADWHSLTTVAADGALMGKPGASF